MECGAILFVVQEKYKTEDFYATAAEVNSTGSNIDNSSKENQNLKEQLNKDKASATAANAQVTNVNQQGAPTPSPQPSVDDRPAYLRKKDGR